MKKWIAATLIAIFWMVTLWMSFWFGFLKSQTIAIQIQHLDDARLLSDQKSLLTTIDAGQIPEAQQSLKDRISIGESLAQMQHVPQAGVMETLSYVIYPREALSLIRVSNADARDQKK